MPKVVKKRISSAANYIISNLESEGAYIGNESVTTNSVYIKFANEDLRSLTIRDHDTRAKYKYKWNLRMDKLGAWKEEDSNVTRYFFGKDKIDDLIQHIKNYSRKVSQTAGLVYANPDKVDIVEVKGDLLNFDNYDVIMQQVNCQGVMGSGLAKQIRSRFPNIYSRYKEICTIENTPNEVFGRCFIGRSGDKEVLNLFGQLGYGRGKHTNYIKLGEALSVAAEYCKSQGIDRVGVPKNMGAGLGGGDWQVIKELIKEAFKDSGIVLYVVEYH